MKELKVILLIEINRINNNVLTSNNIFFKAHVIVMTLMWLKEY